MSCLCRTESFGFEDEEAVSCGSNGGRRESNGRTRTKDPCLGKMALGEIMRMIVMNLVIGDAYDHKPGPRTLANASWCLIILWFLSMMAKRAMMIMTRMEMDMLLIKSKDPCLGKVALGEIRMMRRRMIMKVVMVMVMITIENQDQGSLSWQDGAW